ncbi:putative DNA invertase [Xenorhabdus miraniensis]|uniref:Putative DNA invertase n=1 Tax=Xenorhabdus miraniensis TaxID=351674 RepID=A0A2D0JS17_9GAMM|nr:putative DNA invertase [Xenorhabdus miraniensis]
MQELQLHMMSAFNQFERALIRERQTERIAAKKQRGERTGRPPADINKLSQIDALKTKGIKLKLACDNVEFAQLNLQNLKAVLAESIAQADRGELHSIDDVFVPLTVGELEGKA